MFVRRQSLGASSEGFATTYHVLGVDNVLRAFLPTSSMIGGVRHYDPPPLNGDQPGFNIVIRVASGAYEYVVQGMPHPDSMAARSMPAPGAASNAPYNAAVQTTGPAPASPAVTVTYGSGNFVDVPATVQSSGFSTSTPTMNITADAPAAQPKSNGALWAILAAGAAFFLGQ